MDLKELKPRKALNKAYLKVKPNRTEIEGFKTNLIQLLDRTNETESEEFHKNLVIDFLKKTYYDPNHFINTKGRNDLVIHNGNNATSTVGVIIEAKKPTNKAEMISTKKLNAKAFQELVLYYLRERITHKNLEVKHLIATNINEWFIFDSNLFDRLFAQNKSFVQQFIDFEGGRLAENKTDFFYKQIAEPFIATISTEIEFTYFDFQEYQNALRNINKEDDNKLIALFKILSAEHLLKLPFTNDSNSLDKRFYSELLHIIGLTELTLIFAFTFVFSNADKLELNKNTCEKLALEKISISNDKVVFVDNDCTVLSWDKITDSTKSVLNGKLLKKWKITTDNKQYYQTE
jgi:hypothetical protein